MVFFPAASGASVMGTVSTMAGTHTAALKGWSSIANDIPLV